MPLIAMLHREGKVTEAPALDQSCADTGAHVPLLLPNPGGLQKKVQFTQAQAPVPFRLQLLSSDDFSLSSLFFLFNGTV